MPSTKTRKCQRPDSGADPNLRPSQTGGYHGLETWNMSAVLALSINTIQEKCAFYEDKKCYLKLAGNKFGIFSVFQMCFQLQKSLLIIGHLDT